MRNSRWLVFAIAAAILGQATPAFSQTPCDTCFAVFVMPDTQNYGLSLTPHVNMLFDFICDANDAGGFVEPDPATGAPGKQMPIVMVTHLGDLANFSTNQAGVFWDAMFNKLDTPAPGCSVPYIIAIGNEDLNQPAVSGIPVPLPRYKGESFYDQAFTPNRAEWAMRTCVDPSNCFWPPWLAGPQEWFIAEPESLVPTDPRKYGPNRIDANSRNHFLFPAEPTGPSQAIHGRHRAAVIRLPGVNPGDGSTLIPGNRGRMLFLGLDLAFDDGSLAGNGDDVAYIDRVLDDYAGVPTFLIHHT